MPLVSRRGFLSGISAAALPAPAARAEPLREAAGKIELNDASRLNPTPVAKHIVISGSDDQKVVGELRAVLSEAKAEGRPVVMGGARHSMGGQSLCRGASALTNQAFFCEPDRAAGTYRASAGARWNAIVPALDRIGFSVAVMQSNNDFSIGGTLSVNGHGWAVPFGGFGSSVRSFRLMLADGTLLTCSAREHEDLYQAAIGGYGLFGFVLDAELDMVPNVSLKPRLQRMDAGRLGETFAAAVHRSPDLRMAYARLSVSRRSYLSQSLLVTFRETSDTAHPLSAEEARLFGLVSRTMLRAQLGSEKRCAGGPKHRSRLVCLPPRSRAIGCWASRWRRSGTPAQGGPTSCTSTSCRRRGFPASSPPVAS
jgi:hypothetical protein